MQGSVPIQKIVRKPAHRNQKGINSWMRGKAERERSQRDESRDQAAWWSQAVNHVR